MASFSLGYLYQKVKKTYSISFCCHSLIQIFCSISWWIKLNKKILTLLVTMRWILWWLWWWRWHWYLARATVIGLLWSWCICICCNSLCYYITAVYHMWRGRWAWAWDMCTSRDFIRVPWDVKWITWSNYCIFSNLIRTFPYTTPCPHGNWLHNIGCYQCVKIRWYA
jgi:hypothetical protein